MYIFLPIIILSTLGVLVIFLRKMPQAKQVPIHNASAFYESWLYKIPNKIKNFRFGDVRESFLNFIEKLLRKFKIMALKFENILGDLVVKLRSKRQNGNSLEDKKDSVKNLNNALDESEDKESLEVIKDVNLNEEIIAKDIIYDISKEDDTSEKELKNNEFEEEEKKILAVISENPKSVDAYKDLGFLYQKHGDLKDAKNSFEQAVKLGYRGKDVKDALEGFNESL